PRSGPMLQRRPDGQLCKLLSDEQARGLGALFGQLRQAKHDPPRFNAGIAYALLAAWESQISSDHVACQNVHPAVERAARIIQAEDQPLSLEDIAAQSGLSASRLSRLFHKQVGISLVRFRQKQALERFFRVYGHGEEKTMLAAALEAGFGSYPQFHRVFKQLVGKTPAHYRREMVSVQNARR